jgi:ATP-dependent DNA helicase DinG
VSKIVRAQLLDRMRTTVLTSATLTVDGRFDTSENGWASPGARCACHRVRLHATGDHALPPRMLDPRSPDCDAAGGEVVEILRRSRGRLVLLRATRRFATSGHRRMAVDYPIFVQGTVPRSQLLKQFRETPHSVLFATSSFWQGVDVVGDALSCVVIDKLPFASPSDPITAARIDTIRSEAAIRS